jgi:hypothetical protein
MTQKNDTLLNNARCPVCGEAGYCRKPPAGTWGLYQCGRCRLEFCHPMPDQATLNKFYANYHDPRAAANVVDANAGRNFQKLQSYGLRRNSRLLDYGSGQGIFGRMGDPGRWDSYDPYIDQKNSIPSGQTYDWITLWEVLEHCPDPNGVFDTLAKLLRPEGYLAMTTVWIDSKIPYQIKPPEHLTYWTREAMTIALEASNFEMLTFEPYQMVQAGDVYLQAVLRTVPETYRTKIYHKLPELVEVPTNEIFVVAKRK